MFRNLSTLVHGIFYTSGLPVLVGGN